MSWTCERCRNASPGGSTFCATCGARRPSSPAHDARIGEEILGRYRIVAKLGEGAMGAVYRAEQRMGTTVRSVAVKVLHSSHVRDPALRARFVRECELVVHLQHPNTIKFFDFGELSDGSLAIAMEYVDGESLADQLVRGPIPLDRALRIVGQICGSLHEAHSRGIVHRDLKPENVLLSNPAGQQDVVKVLDFGIAKDASLQGSLTVQGTVIGTPQYMSPEQFTGRALDARSDVYSLGVLVYEMLTGTFPFVPGATVFEWAERHLNAAPIPIESHAVAGALSPAARAALMSSLAKQPEHRPPGVLELARALVGRERLESELGLVTLRGEPAPVRPLLPTTAMPVGPHGAGSPMYLAGASSAHAAPARARGGALTIAMSVIAAALLLGAGGGAALYFSREREPDRATRIPPEPTHVIQAPAPDAGAPLAFQPIARPEPPPNPVVPTPPSEPMPAHWLRIVHHQRRVQEPSLATGPPDQRHASIESGGLLTLELLPGSTVSTDGGPGPDLYVVVDSASGPYRVEVARSHHGFVTIVPEVTGTLPLDIDQFDLDTVRYVRVSSRSTRPVLIDALGVYRTSAAGTHHH